MKTSSSHSSVSAESLPSTARAELNQLLDPAAPPVFRRILQIGEYAGLVTPKDRDAVIDAFGPSRRHSSVARIVDFFQCDETELYTLVTLFSSEPRALSLPVIARDTLTDATTLREALRHLEELGAVSIAFTASAEPTVALKPAGRVLAVMFIYRLLRSTAMPDRVNAQDGASVADRSQTPWR